MSEESRFSVDLTQIPATGLEFDLRATAADLDFGEAGFELAGLLRLAGRLGPVPGSGFRLTGELAGTVQLECVRCLEPYRFPITESLDLVFLPAPTGYHSPTPGSARIRSGGEQGLDEDDMNVSFFAGDRLHLAETVWEQSHLAIPFQPICDPGCRGLCSGCGRNRNQDSPCGCDARQTGGGAFGSLRAMLDSR